MIPARCLLSAALFAAALPASAQRAQAALDCKPAQQDLVYDCTLRLARRDGTPLPTGVQVSIGADMPSMPMAHNVRPVAAEPTAKPGEYSARLTLEMHGQWAIKLRLSGAADDVLVVHYAFEPNGARPIQPAKSGASR